MPLILPGNVASATASTTYDVDNSCRFNSGDDPSLSRTPSSAGNQKTFTISVWFKISNLTFTDSGGGTSRQIIGQSAIAGNYFRAMLEGGNNGTLKVYSNNSFSLKTNRLFRDVSAWYHLLVVIDTTQGTASDRAKLYINGVQETSFSIETYPSQNTDMSFNNSRIHSIGRTTYSGGYDYYDGYMSEVVFIDGQALDPTSFGQFDSASPNIWKPKDVSGLTFGTNGFYLDFEDSSALGNDVSGNDNDFTSSNLDATDQATDTPSNNFATLNPLINVNSTANYPANYYEGNCRLVPSGDWVTTVTTLGAAAGKWYAEIEYDNAVYAGIIGVIGEDAVNTGVDILSNNLGEQTSCVGYKSTTGAVRISGSSATAGSSYTTGDIIQVALDLDNGNVYFGKNDTWQNSGDPESGATGTGAYAIGGPAGQFWFFSCGPYATTASMECNFGGCSAFTVSSGNADADGYGAFEFAPPTGYYALCTKNLAEYG
jgi:hypothetical protein